MGIVRACVVGAAACFAFVMVAGCSSATEEELDAKKADDANNGANTAEPGEAPPPDSEAALKEGESPEPPAVGRTSSALTWRAGWHYVTWPTAGLRRWNPSSCGGTVQCNLRAGQWVYWHGGPIAGCGGAGNNNTGDVYVHNTPCGFNGWIRQDALN
jgi:hypothetical protein